MMPMIGVVDVDCGCTRAEEIWTSKRLLGVVDRLCDAILRLRARGARRNPGPRSGTDTPVG